jgi:hypothetical protein
MIVIKVWASLQLDVVINKVSSLVGQSLYLYFPLYLSSYV